MSYAGDDRAALADALEEAAPDAPTLCAGWTVRDLAAHLVVRERRPDSLPGLALPGLGAWTEQARQAYARRPLAELVAAFRGGPPPWSPFALPRADAVGNLTEHFVHLEDVRRARPGWEPRELSDGHRRALWRAVSERGRMFYRRSPVGVVLVVPGGPRRQVRRGALSVVLTGRPEELLLHAHGRGRQALVDVDGPAEAVEAFAGTALGL